MYKLPRKSLMVTINFYESFSIPLSSLSAHLLPLSSNMINDQIWKPIETVDMEYNQRIVRYKNICSLKSSIWTKFHIIFFCQFCPRFVILSKRKVRCNKKGNQSFWEQTFVCSYDCFLPNLVSFFCDGSF